jgi:MFS family permease
MGIWGLGLTSMFMDISSELVHSLLPLFMTTVLGASMVTIGILEGIAESIASITKVFSGTLSDHWGRRKPLLVLGYGLAALTKPVFPLATTIAWVAAARFTDRMGKGIRGAPRDALVADITPAHARGAAYGLRQALDSVGAFIGPLLAVLFMALLAGDITAVLWIGVVPAFISVLVLVFAVREPRRVVRAPSDRSPLSWHSARRLSLRYWLIVALGAVFTLARFSEAFLVLRAQQTGFATTLVPVVMVVMNAVYAGAAYPAGRASDMLDRRTLLIAGLAVLIGADLVLAFASSAALVLTGAALWGLHMAMTQGLFSKLIADAAPADLRGTAFGVFNLVTGMAVLLASGTAGVLWSTLGPSATFLAGAAFAALAAGGLMAYRLWRGAGAGTTR